MLVTSTIQIIHQFIINLNLAYLLNNGYSYVFAHLFGIVTHILLNWYYPSLSNFKSFIWVGTFHRITHNSTVLITAKVWYLLSLVRFYEHWLWCTRVKVFRIKLHHAKKSNINSLLQVSTGMPINYAYSTILY